MLFAENSQILKISVIPIVLTFICLVALNLLVNKQLIVQLNSSLRHIIVTQAVLSQGMDLLVVLEN